MTSEEPTIVIVGLHSAGKSTLGRALARAMGGHVLELGDGIRSRARERGSHNLVELARELLADDPLVLATGAVSRAMRHPGPQVFVGPRTTQELEHLLRLRPRALTVGVDTPSELRKERWHRRHLRFEDTWEEREWQEREWETAKLIGDCDLIIRGSDRLAEKTINVVEAIRSKLSDP